MFCIRCGKVIDDSVLFCPFCGQKTDDKVMAPKPQPVVRTQPRPQSPAGGYPPRPRPVATAKTATANKKSVLQQEQRTCWRGMASSPFVMILAILFTMGLMITLFNIGNSVEMLASVDAMLGTELSDMWIIGVIAQTPAILVVVGLWLLFAEGFKRGEEVNAIGLSLIRSAMIIRTVIASILVAVLLLASCGASASAGELYDAYGYGGFLQEIMDALAVVVVIGGGFAIAYYAINVKALGHAKDVAECNYPHTDGLIGLAVFRIIMLSGTFILMISGMELGFSGVISLLGEVMAVVAIFIYKGKMEYMGDKFSSLSK